MGSGTRPVDDEIGICRQGLNHPVEIRLQAPTAQTSALEDTDVLHYVLDIEIVPTFDWLGGTNTISVRSLIDGLSTFQIRLHDTFDITSVLVDGSPAACSGEA